jgi:hypothetical protein
MTDRERAELAREAAKSMVARLRASNERAARKGAPRVEQSEYAALQRVLERKLRRA